VRDCDFFSQIEAGDGADGEQFLFDLVETKAISGDLGETLGSSGQVKKPLRVQSSKVAGFEGARSSRRPCRGRPWTRRSPA
jgi:hypothetical protein